MKISDKNFGLRPDKTLKVYLAKIGLNLGTKVTFEQFRFFLLKILDDYLRGKVLIDDFFQFIAVMEFRPHDEDPKMHRVKLDPGTPSSTIEYRESLDGDFFTADEIIEYLSDVSSYEEIKKHPPTLELVEKTGLTANDYPYDWAMREALRYYKENRYLLDTVAKKLT